MYFWLRRILSPLRDPPNPGGAHEPDWGENGRKSRIQSLACPPRPGAPQAKWDPAKTFFWIHPRGSPEKITWPPPKPQFPSENWCRKNLFGQVWPMVKPYERKIPREGGSSRGMEERWNAVKFDLAGRPITGEETFPSRACACFHQEAAYWVKGNFL